MKISPTAIDTARGCLRKVAYRRKRPRKPPGPSAAYGLRVHDVLDAWQRTRTPPDMDTPEGRTAAPALALTPMPGSAVPERAFTFAFEGLTYTGRIDLTTIAMPFAIVTDYKTIGRLADAKSADTLRDDPQGVIYPMAVLMEHPDVERVAAQWIYLQRGARPRAREVVFARDAQEVRDRFHELHTSEGVRLAALADAEPEDLPRSREHCNDYGGCPYRTECLGRWASVAAAERNSKR